MDLNRNIVKISWEKESSLMVKDEIDENYSFKEFQTDLMLDSTNTVSSFRDIVEIDVEDNMKTENSYQESQKNSIYLSGDDQWNAEIDSNIMINESECILPCSYICETSLNEIGLTRDFDTNFHDSFCDTEDIDKFDLGILLEDNVTQDIYNCGMNDDNKMCHINELKFKETSGVCTVKNDSKRKHIIVNIMNKLKKKKKNSQLKSKNHSRVKSFESNNTLKPSTNVLNNMLNQQFSIFDDIETLPYLPLSAMQLMIDIELSNTKCNSCKDYNKRKKKSLNSTDNINKKCENPFKPCKNHRLSTPNMATTKRLKVCKKDTRKIECINTENVKLSNLTPIIPLPVLHYMNILESVESTQNALSTKLINELLNNW